MGRRHDPLLSLPDKTGVLYVRLYQRMRALILEGSWPPGMRLPSSRTLASDLGIARNTASLAIDQLLADGWVEARSRSGTFVSASLPERVSRPATPRDSTGGGKLPIPFELRPGAVDIGQVILDSTPVPRELPEDLWMPRPEPGAASLVLGITAVVVWTGLTTAPHVFRRLAH